MRLDWGVRCPCIMVCSEQIRGWGGVGGGSVNVGMWGVELVDW